MRFREAVRTIRLRKKRINPQAFTQAACGSRMTDRNGNPAPVGQVGWSRYETEDYVPEYDTVVGICNALNATPDEKETIFRLAGFTLETTQNGKDLDYRGGVELDLLSGEKRPLTSDEIRALFARFEEDISNLRETMLRYAIDNKESKTIEK